MKTILTLATLLLSLEMAAADTLFVTNQGVNTLSSFDESGNSTAYSNPYLIGPSGIAIDRSGNLFIATNANTIEKFSSTGVHLFTFASVGLNQPMALAFDREGNLYAANFAGGTVEKFSPSGSGTTFATITRPAGLAFDSLGNLYVSTFSNLIEEFSPTGADLGVFTSSNLLNPEGLAFDSLGNLYASNNAANTVVKFSPSGAPLGLVAAGLSGPAGLVFDSLGNLFIVNSHSATLTRIDPDGTASVFATTQFLPAFIAIQVPPRLANISTRGQVLTGDEVLDAGFIIVGEGVKNILIRGLGPSLTQAGVTNTLADPILELHDGTGAVVAINDNWQQTQAAEISATGIPPGDPAEAAMVETLAAGSYTVIERGKNNGTGIGLVEVYDLDWASGPELANISTRGFVGTSNQVMIAGFIVSARTGGSSTVLARALGPSLGTAGVVNPLSDPVLELRDGDGNLIASDDDWQTTQAAAITATGIPPTNPTEAAIVATLMPGNYTAIESGKNGGTGVGLVEVYRLP